MSNIIDQTKEAYQDKLGTDIPTPIERDLSFKSNIEKAALGYAKEAREKEIKRTPSKSTLRNVLALIDQGRLPEGLAAIAKSPPTKEDARYLPVEVQRLVNDLTILNKAIDAIPITENNVQELRNLKESWTGEAIKAGITDKQSSVNGLSYPHHLDIEEKALSKINSERDSIIRGAREYAKNNPDIMKGVNQRLEVLVKELPALQPYNEAKAGIPLKTKTARMWLDDVAGKPSLDDRILAQRVLEKAGIDHKAILSEVSRQGLSETDKAIEEMREQKS